ncbi:MAG: hypothetical protein JW953_01880 [Anaerolineae bacterium]|nr:hypothetical protein [Anaerolineae bacterium]
MATDYIETRAKDGTVIRIEVASGAKTATGFGPHPISADAEATANAYNNTLTTIRACANGIIDTLQSLDAWPSTASIDFALKIDAKAGVMIAKSPGDAQFKISLTWKQPEAEKEEV